MSKRVHRSLMFSLAMGLTVAITGLDVFAVSQEPTTPNPPTTKQTTSKKRSSTAKKTKPATTNPEATGDQTAPVSNEITPTQPEQATPTTVPASPTEQTDLSGTYSGVFNCDALGLTGDTTLTITGNQFTTADGKSGRIVASTTRGYTAVALQLGEGSAAPSTIVSLRGRKKGKSLTLSPVSNGQACSFAPATMASRRTRRSSQTPPAPTGVQVASPAEAGPAPADVTSPATPTRRNSRKGASRSKPAPSIPSTPTTMPATPTETTPPTQSPSPSPTPSPSGSPTSSPSPESSPSPSASPSPSPSPAPKRP